MTSEFELYNARWEEIDGYLSSAYEKVNHNENYLAEYLGRLNTDSREGLNVIFDYVKVKIRILKSGEYRRILYSANLFPLYFSLSLGVVFLFFVIYWASDSWKTLIVCSLLAVWLLYVMRSVVKTRLQIQTFLDKTAIIALREQESELSQSI